MRIFAIVFGMLLLLFGGGCALYISIQSWDHGGYFGALNQDFGGLVGVLTMGPMLVGALIVALAWYSRRGKQ